MPGAQHGTEECHEFAVYALDHLADSPPLLDQPLSFRAPSAGSNSELSVCQLGKTPGNRAFLKLFQKEHGSETFPPTGFSLQQDASSKWIHTPRKKQHSPLSNYYDFVLVRSFTGVAPP